MCLIDINNNNNRNLRMNELSGTMPPCFIFTYSERVRNSSRTKNQKTTNPHWLDFLQTINSYFNNAASSGI